MGAVMYGVMNIDWKVSFGNSCIFGYIHRGDFYSDCHSYLGSDLSHDDEGGFSECKAGWQESEGFAITYIAGKLLKLSHDIAAPASMIGASNFFELAVAVAIALFGTTSPAALAATVGVLTEVPVMLALCWFVNKTGECC